MKKHAKLFWFMTFQTKSLLLQNLCVLDGTSYLISFGLEKYDAIYNRNRHLQTVEYVFSHNYARIKIDLYDPLSLEKNIEFAQCYNVH